MPEGDTVWLAARTLNAALAGQVLRRTDFRVPALATVDLAGRRVLEVRSRGKHLLTRIEGLPGDDAAARTIGGGIAGAARGRITGGGIAGGITGGGISAGGITLHTHFRMDGSWHLYRRGEPWRGPQFQVRAVLETDRHQAVGFRLPVVELLPTAREHEAVGHLGPDLLGEDWDLDEAVRRLGAQPEREIGTALLDQRNLAGIGNLYKTEVLFLRGLTPWLRVAEVPDLPGLVELARRLLLANRDGWAQVTTGNPRRGEQHWVFEREGRRCRRCGSGVLTAEQGEPPYQRICYWCPQCQRGPAPPASRSGDRPPPPQGGFRYRP